MSQSELARRVPMDQSSINSLIKGKTRRTKYLHKIARELRTTTAFLEGETEDPSSELSDETFSFEELQLLHLIRGLEDKDRSALLHLARSLSSFASRTLHDNNHVYKGHE